MLTSKHYTDMIHGIDEALSVVEPYRAEIVLDVQTARSRLLKLRLYFGKQRDRALKLEQSQKKSRG